MKQYLLKAFVCMLAITLLFSLTGCKSSDYDKAMGLYNSGAYQEAAELFTALEDYENSAEMLSACRYALAVEQMSAGQFAEAAEVFYELGSYENSEENYSNCKYELALADMAAGNYENAKDSFTVLGDYKDSAQYAKIIPCYQLAEVLRAEGPKEYNPSTEDYKVVLSAEDEDVFVLELIHDGESNGWKTAIHYTARIPIGSPTAELHATGLLEKEGRSQDEGRCTWDIQNYTMGSGVKWETYEVSGYAYDGSPLPEDMAGICEYSEGVLQEMVSGLNLILYLAYTNHDIFLTITDFGFSSL